MNDYEQLVGLVADSVTADDAAQKILDAGFCKPRTASTVEELDALPLWSTVLDGGHDYCTRYENGWCLTNHDDGETTEVWLPATVLYIPGSSDV